MCCEGDVLVRCFYSGLVGNRCRGMAVCGSCGVVGLRWWADVYCACVPLVVSCSSSCLFVHS